MDGVYYTDSHCHLDLLRNPEDAIRKAKENKVLRMVTIGIDAESSRKAVGFALRYPEQVRAAVGIHPHDATGAVGDALMEIERMAKEPMVVAIGEIGLDFYRNLSPTSAQETAFRDQIQIAKALRLPIVIHDRDAHDEVYRILKEEGVSFETNLKSKKKISDRPLHSYRSFPFLFCKAAIGLRSKPLQHQGKMPHDKEQQPLLFYA